MLLGKKHQKKQFPFPRNLKCEKAKHKVYNENNVNLIFKPERSNSSTAEGRLLCTHNTEEIHDKTNFMHNP